MTKINPQESGKKNFFKKIIKSSIAAIIVLGIFSALLIAGQITFIFQIFSWIQHWVRNITGADILIVNGITAILLAVLCLIFLLVPLQALIKAFLPFPMENKNLYRASVFICFAIISFAIYFLSRDVFFSPETGQPLKYYTITPNGQYKFYSSEGFDSVTGDTLKKVTKDIILKHLKQTGEETGENNFQNNKNVDGFEAELQYFVGTLTNHTSRTIIFAISPNLVPPANSPDKKVSTLDLSTSSPRLSIVKLVRPGEIISISLIEGKHFLALFEPNGTNIAPNVLNSQINRSGMFISLSSGFDFKPEALIWKVHWYDIGKYSDSIYDEIESDYNSGHIDLNEKKWKDKKYYDCTNKDNNFIIQEGPQFHFNGKDYKIETAYTINIEAVNNWQISVENFSSLSK